MGATKVVNPGGPMRRVQVIRRRGGCGEKVVVVKRRRGIRPFGGQA